MPQCVSVVISCTPCKPRSFRGLNINFQLLHTIVISNDFVSVHIDYRGNIDSKYALRLLKNKCKVLRFINLK